MTKTKQKNLFRSVHTTACSVCLHCMLKTGLMTTNQINVYAMINIFLHDKQSKSLRTLLVCFSIT